MSFLKYWAEMSLGRMQSLKTWPSVSYLRAVRHPPVTSSSSLPSPHTFSLGLLVVRASLSDPTSCWASACLWLCVRCLGQWQPIKEIKPVNPKGNQLWIIIWRTDAQAEAPILWPPDVTNQDSILKSRDITLPTKVQLVKAMLFPVVMYGCESWTVKKAEYWGIDAFEL